MNLIPAIDIKDGQCVRLLKGNFNDVTTYPKDPTSVANRFSQLQVKHLHVVDLDGARSGNSQNSATVAAILASSSLDIQVGGGIRHRDNVAHWIDHGVARCVVGSAALSADGEFTHWIREFGPDRLVLALDVGIIGDDEPVLMTHG